MVLGKRWLFSIGNGAEIQPLEIGRKSPVLLHVYEGGSICNENPFITPSTNALESYAICQTKDQSVAVKMVHETLFYLFKFNKLHIV